MKCPVDQVDLVMAERQGVEIDYCPTCRGVWLDRGELDKIIDRAAPGGSPVTASPRTEDRSAQGRYDDGDDRYRDDRGGDDRYRGDKRRKKRSFLEDIFDFD